jgi:hypothetical protein
MALLCSQVSDLKSTELTKGKVQKGKSQEHSRHRCLWSLLPGEGGWLEDLERREGNLFLEYLPPISPFLRQWTPVFSCSAHAHFREKCCLYSLAFFLPALRPHLVCIGYVVMNWRCRSWEWTRHQASGAELSYIVQESRMRKARGNAAKVRLESDSV